MSNLGAEKQDASALCPPGGRDRRRLVMGLSVAAAVLMVVGKVIAYAMTGSSAIFADAAESLVHGFATGGAAFALWYADRPQDADHRYGHGKIVYLSAGFEGALILVAGVVTIAVSARSLLSPKPLASVGWGLAITGGLALLNVALGTALLLVGKRQRSLVLIANGKHVMADVWIGGGAVLGLGLAAWTGQRWIDPAVGLLVGLQILYSAGSLLRDAYHGLMDRADPQATAALERCLGAAVEAGRIVEFHELRHRASNDQAWVEVHLIFSKETCLDEAHDIATMIESELVAALPDARNVFVTSHLEPPKAHSGESS
jgi:cation diffusion facilitator family transporter